MNFSRFKKWSLFFVLAGALGFNLSMNPEQLSYFARIEKYSTEKMDWATSSPDASQEKSQKISNREFLVGGKRGSFKAKVYQLDDSTIVRFENMDQSEGKTCELCGRPFFLSSEFKNIADVNRELLALVNDKPIDKVTASKDEDKEEVKVVQKKGEATDVDLDEWAEKCDKASDSSKLSCHKNRLIELSKYLKNSPDMAHFVTEYFNQYLKSDIMTGFTSPTIKSNIFSNGFGVMQPTLESDTSLLEQSNDFSESIISGLRGKNGKGVVEALVKMRASSFTAQMRNSQRLMSEGLNEGNQYKFQIGLQGMQPDYQKLLLQQTTQDLYSSVDSMSATGTEKSYFQNYVGTNLYSPVDTILNQLKSFVMGQDANSANGKHNFTDFQIPSLGESMILLPNQVSVVNNNSNSLLRPGSQDRGSSIQIQWGTGEGAIRQSVSSVPGVPSQQNLSPFANNNGQSFTTPGWMQIQQAPAGRSARGGTPF